MPQLDEADDFYAAGRRLAKYIADSEGKAVSTAVLQALIRDLLPQHYEAQEALIAIVARPDFEELVNLAGSKKGSTQKCTLIKRLAEIYSAKMVTAADELVCGLLGHEMKLIQKELEVETDIHEAINNKLIGDESIRHSSPMINKQAESTNSLLRQIDFNIALEISKTMGFGKLESASAKSSSKGMFNYVLRDSHCNILARVPLAMIDAYLRSAPSTKNNTKNSENQLDYKLINSTNDGEYPSSAVGEAEVETTAADTKNRENASLTEKANYHPQIQQPNKTSTSAPTNIKQFRFVIGTITFLGGFVVLAMLSTSSNKDANTSQGSSSYIPTPSDTPEAVQTLSNLETEQKGAILMCEHQPIVEKVKSLNLIDPQNIGRRDALIASSDRQISFLNQDSAKGYKYWEDASCTWGEQWFDNDDENNFRLFLAISRKCPTPTLNYTLAKDKNRKEILSKGAYNAYGHSVGEIRIPYPQESAYIFIDKVSCS